MDQSTATATKRPLTPEVVEELRNDPDFRNHAARDERVKEAVEEASAAFWSAIAGKFPECTTGDLQSDFEATVTPLVDEWLMFNWPNLGFYITPGVIDENARVACREFVGAGFAVALYDAAGWTPVLYASAGADQERWLAQRADGSLVDIDGTHTPAEIEALGLAKTGTEGRAAAFASHDEYMLDLRLLAGLAAAMVARLAG
jgi:hypothetical protein